MCRSALSLFTILLLSYFPERAWSQFRSFERTYLVDVDAAPILGTPVYKELSDEMRLPPGYTILNQKDAIHGLKVIEKDDAGMDERYWSVEPIDNGVRIVWKLRNRNRGPLVRSAKLKVQLQATRNCKMSLSPQYIAMRKRFLNAFYYNGRVAASIDFDSSTAINDMPGKQTQTGYTFTPICTKIVFGDQTFYLGHALMVFATEIAIRKDASLDTTEARQIVKQLLTTFDELDCKAEAYFGGKIDLYPNGLFIRDDIVDKNNPVFSGRLDFGKTSDPVTSDWKANDSKEDNSPSGDQVISMLDGCNYVVRYSYDDDLIKHAKAISLRIYDYAKRNGFVLKKPNGDNLIRDGGDCSYFAPLMHAVNRATTGYDDYDKTNIHVGNQELPLSDTTKFWKSRESQELFIKHIDDFVCIPFLGRYDIKSFIFNNFIMLLAATDEFWTQDTIEWLSLHCMHHHAILFYSLNTKSIPKLINSNDIENLLKKCPSDGPRASAAAATGWQRDSRMTRCRDTATANTGTDRFNGLDWMLLHNMNQLMYYGP